VIFDSTEQHWQSIEQTKAQILAGDEVESRSWVPCPRTFTTEYILLYSRPSYLNYLRNCTNWWQILMKNLWLVTAWRSWCYGQISSTS